MKSLEEVLAAIESEDVKEAVVGLINAETQRGKDSYNKKDKEVLKYKSVVKDLGYDSEKYDNLDAFINAKKGVEKKVTDSELTIAQLNDKVNSVVSELETERQKAVQEALTAKKSKLMAKLTKSIGNKFYGSSFLIENLVNEDKVDLDGDNVVFVNGDNKISFDDGLKQLINDNKDSVKPDLKSGTGDVGGNSETPEGDESFAAQLKREMNVK